MTLKYESEILFDLMKRDGDDTPSDVLPYESELKEKYLKQVEGAYPKLMDYRPEWLNYNLEAHLPADFPVETLSNVTSATVDNVVPYAYRSAILKGQTLINLIRPIGKTILGQYQDVINLNYVKPSTKYLLKIKNNTSEAKSFYSSEITEWTQIDIEANQTITKTLTTKSTLGRNTLLQNAKTHETEHDLSIIFIEYQDGMENWDIPYFEGMKSVQMPVLTTIGRNILNPKRFVSTTTTSSNDGVVINISRQTENSNFRSLYDELTLPVDTYTITCEVVNGTYLGGNLCIFDENNSNRGELAFKNGRGSITITSSINKLRLWNAYGTDNCQIRVTITKDGSTEYEPYKSNILTVNEDVTLRGIGDVKDELNCLTGEVTQRIGEIILTGNMNWKKGTPTSNCNVFGLLGTEYSGLNIKVNSKIISDTYASGTSENQIVGGNYFIVQILKPLTTTLEDFKKELNQKPLKIQYPLATESVKTVDLNIQDQDGNTLRKIIPIEGTMHIHSDGTPLKPSITMEIPVEAITQNLASFIKEE